MKLAGRPMQQIADAFEVDRVTFWRWLKKVQAEFGRPQSRAITLKETPL